MVWDIDCLLLNINFEKLEFKSLCNFWGRGMALPYPYPKNCTLGDVRERRSPTMGVSFPETA